MLLEEREVERLERLEVPVAGRPARRLLAVHVVVVERDADGVHAVDLELHVQPLDERGLARRGRPRDRDDPDPIARGRDLVGELPDPLLVEPLRDADELGDLPRDAQLVERADARHPHRGEPALVLRRHVRAGPRAAAAARRPRGVRRSAGPPCRAPARARRRAPRAGTRAGARWRGGAGPSRARTPRRTTRAAPSPAGGCAAAGPRRPSPGRGTTSAPRRWPRTRAGSAGRARRASASPPRCARRAPGGRRSRRPPRPRPGASRGTAPCGREAPARPGGPPRAGRARASGRRFAAPPSGSTVSGAISASAVIAVERETGFCPSSPATTTAPSTSAGSRSMSRVPVRTRRSCPAMDTTRSRARGRERPRSRSPTSPVRCAISSASAVATPVAIFTASGGSLRSSAAHASAESRATLSGPSDVTVSPRCRPPSSASSPNESPGPRRRNASSALRSVAEPASTM